MRSREPLPVTVYTPDSAIANPRKLLSDMLHDLCNSRELAWRLAVRDINAQYRQTLLGFAWALLVPLGHAAVWILLARSGLLAVSPTELPYPAFVLTGTMLWAIFAEAVHAPLGTVAAARDMLVRINFPREALILSGLIQVGFNATIKLAVIILALIALGVRPDWGIIAAPLGVAVLMLAGTAVGLFLLPFGLLYSDIGRILPFVMQALMYLTPVVYPVPADGFARTLLTLNPITTPLEVSRQWLTGGSPGLTAEIAMITVGALVLTLALWVVYRQAIPIVIERMSS